MQPGDKTDPEDQQPSQDSHAAGWQFNGDDADAPPEASFGPIDSELPPVESVHWSASEFVHHDKSTTWYLILAGITFVVAIGLFLLTKDFITTGVIVLVAIVFGFVAARKPRTLEYSIDQSGITISERHYTYDLFKSFSVVDEDQIAYISLMPIKRFMPMVTMYYPMEREDEIADVLGNYLPYEHRDSAMVDDLMRRLRF